MKLNKFKNTWLGLGALYLWGAVALATGDRPFYDEVFHENGEVRSQYKQVYEEYSKLTAADKKTFFTESLKRFEGDNALGEFPRFILKSEDHVIKKGVEQRGLAIRMFLQDYYGGKWSEIEKIIPRPVLERIVSRTSDLGYQGQIDPATISFPYGPDIIRDAAGNWRVIEDNPGYIGGPGDLIRAREIMMSMMPKYAPLIKAKDDPLDYYKAVVERAKKLSVPHEGKTILLSVPPFPDHEEGQLIKAYTDLGVESVISGQGDKKLIVTDQGVFLEPRGPKTKNKEALREPVGYIILSAEHHEADLTHPAALERAVLDEAMGHLDDPELNRAVRTKVNQALKPDPVTGKRDLAKLDQVLQNSNLLYELNRTKKLQTKGLIQAIIAGKVASNYTPGLDFIGDKEFYFYVETIVRHYLKEEPILKNIPTERFGIFQPDGNVTLNRELLNRVFKNQAMYVTKPVDGRGGEDVSVGAALSPEKFKATKRKITKEFERYISQQFTHLSVMAGLLVDMRRIALVDRLGVYVGPVSWGRGIPLNGDGLVNLSSEGRELATFVVDDPVPNPPLNLTKSSAPGRCSFIYAPYSSLTR